MRKTITTLPLAALMFTSLAANAQSTQSESIDSLDSGLAGMDCIVEPSQVVELGTSVAGVIDQMLAEKNDFVSESEIVAMLDSRLEMATLELATARASIDTSLNLRRENAHFGQRTQNRNQKLFKEATISAQDMDKVRTEAYIAQLQARQEEDNQRIAQLEAERARQALEQRTVRSPINGVIMERYKSIGEYVEAEPVYRIANLDPLHVELIVPVKHLGQIERGMKAQVSIDLEQDSETNHVAVVKSVDRVADAASGTFGVLLSMPNSGLRIPSGVRCQLNFEIE